MRPRAGLVPFLLLPVTFTLLSAAASFAAPGDVIERFDNPVKRTVGLAYDAFRNRMIYFTERTKQGIVLVDIEPPHDAVPLGIDSPTEDPQATGGTVMPGNGRIYAADYAGDFSTIDDLVALYDTDGTLLAYWAVDDHYDLPGSGCTGGNVNKIVDLTWDPDNPFHFFATAADDGNVLYHLDLSDTSGGPSQMSECTLVGTMTPASLDGIIEDVVSIEYDLHHEGYWVSDYESNNVALLDRSFNLLQSFAVEETSFNTGISPMHSVSSFEPYEVWMSDYDSDITTAVDSGLYSSLLADLHVTKDDGQSQFVAGTTVTYTVEVGNSGPTPAYEVDITDSAPADTSIAGWECFATGGAACPNDSGTGDIAETVEVFPDGGVLTYTVSLVVPQVFIGNLTNTVSVSSTTGDPDPTNNSASDTDTQTVGAAVVLKSDGRATYTPGESLLYHVVVANSSGGAVNDFAIIDSAPAGSAIIGWTCTPIGLGAACPNATGAGDIHETVTLPDATALYYRVTLAVASDTTGDLTNTASVADDGGAFFTDFASDTDAQLSVSDLSVTTTDGASKYIPGTTVTYTVTMANAGPSDAPDANIIDSVPAGAAITGWTCTASGGAVCPQVSGTSDLDQTAPTLPAGGSLVYTLDVFVEQSYGAEGGLSSDLTNTARVQSGAFDPDTTDNADTDVDQRASADLTVTKTDGTLYYGPGGSTTYTVTLENLGPDDAVSVILTDNAPVQATGFDWTCTGSNGAVCPSASGSGDIHESIDSLPVGGVLRYRIAMGIDASTRSAVTNTASVESASIDPRSGNDSATDVNTPLAPIPSLTIPWMALMSLLLALLGPMVIGWRRIF